MAARLNGDAQQSYQNGWGANVWFLGSNLHNVEVLTPSGHPLELGGLGRTVLGPLSESSAALILFRVSRLAPTEPDAQAKAQLLAE